MEEFVRGMFENRLTASVAVIIISVILYNLFGRIILKSRKINKKTTNQAERKRRTYMRLIGNVIKYSFIIITILILLQINGVNVSSMIAGLGIVSIVVGLALQDALKDIIMGFNIIMDDFFSIGDVIKYKDIEGKVVSFGLKTTKIQDIINGNIVSISNRNIIEIEKVSEYIYVGIPIPYEQKVEKIEKIISNLVEEVKKCEYVKECKYLGISDFETSDILYKLEVQCLPEFKHKVKRSTLRCIKLILDNNKISIPYQQICIHNEE